MNKPNVIIIGASKCGTTALQEYFRAHRDIYIPQKKEIHFHSSAELKKFTGGPGDKHLMRYATTKDFQEYLNFYKDVKNQKIVIDNSPSYLFFAEESIDSIKKYLGESVKIIVLVRNPIDKMLSQYSHLYSAGRESLTFENALNIEIERKNSFYSDMWLYRESGMMSSKIELYKKNFDNVLVINNYDLNFNKKKTLEQIFNYLEVQIDNYNFSLNISSNASGIPKSRIVSRIFIRPNPFSLFLRRIIPTKIGRKVRDWINRNNKGKKILISDNLRENLMTEFESELNKLNSLIQSETKLTKNA